MPIFETHYLPWWTWIYTASGQLALFVLIVVILSFLLRKRSVRLRYALWCLVLLKAVTPPIWTAGVSPAIEVRENTMQTVPYRPLADETSALPGTTGVPPAIEVRENAMQTVPYRTLAGETPALPGAPTLQMLAELQAELAQPDYPAFVPTLFAVWLGGLTLFFTVRLARFFVALKMLRKARELKSGPIWNLYKNLAAQLKLKKTPRLILSDGVKVPFLFGLFRATIVLPATLPEEITPSELENVLLHELTHYRRCDLWVNWFEFPVQGISGSIRFCSVRFSSCGTSGKRPATNRFWRPGRPTHRLTANRS